MYKQCNTKEGARRQRQIEQCLLELMLTMPFHQITISHICQKAELSRKSFYRYFSSKEGCLHGLIDHCILEASATHLLYADIYNNHRPDFDHYFAYWQENRQILDALCMNNLTNTLFERALLIATNEDFEFRNLINARGREDIFEQALFIVCGTTGLILNWHESGYQKSAAQMAATLNRLLAQSLIVKPDSDTIRRSAEAAQC